MMTTITLYRKNGTCAMASHIILTEIGVEFAAIQLDWGPDGYQAADGSFTHAEYLKINPSGYVPALSVHGTIITETLAILRFLADLAPARQLLGYTALERARTDAWLSWLSGTLHGLGFKAFWRSILRTLGKIIQTCQDLRALQSTPPKHASPDIVMNYNLIVANLLFN